MLIVAAMVYLRSLIFNILFYGLTALLAIGLLPCLLLPAAVTRYMARLWGWTTVVSLRVAGGRHRIGGSIALDRQVIYAAKHQSAWDTLIYNIIVLDCAYVVKRELFLFPFFGWFLWRIGMIGIDRKGGANTLKRLVANCKARLKVGRSIVIFPQGTRTPPGTKNPYLPGVAALYTQCNVPVVPTALNSGIFWPRRTFLKHPGTVVIEFFSAVSIACRGPCL